MGKKQRIKYTLEPYKDFESNGYIAKVKNKHGNYEEKHVFISAISGIQRIDSMAGLTMSMLSHPAFKDLKPRQRLLYLYAKSQYQGMADREDFNKTYQEYAGKKEYIYLNHKLLIDVFEMYTKHTAREMYKDIKVLVEHGFLVPVCKEKNQRTIYKLIGEWQSWTPHKKYIERPGKPFQYEWVDL